MSKMKSRFEINNITLVFSVKVTLKGCIHIPFDHFKEHWEQNQYFLPFYPNNFILKNLVAIQWKVLFSCMDVCALTSFAFPLVHNVYVYLRVHSIIIIVLDQPTKKVVFLKTTNQSEV